MNRDWLEVTQRVLFGLLGLGFLVLLAVSFA